MGETISKYSSDRELISRIYKKIKNLTEKEIKREGGRDRGREKKRNIGRRNHPLASGS
jgi:hypothetical protein